MSSSLSSIPKINASDADLDDLAAKMTGEKNVKVLSFGCGVDSVAGYLILRDEGLLEEYDEIVWADTGSEMPETYAYFEYLTKTLGWKITVIKSYYGRIYDYYRKKKAFPTRFLRDCTGKFKVNPINRYLRTRYGRKAHFDVDIFINYTEAAKRMRTSRVKYATLQYPLVDRRITRERCREIITEHGMPVPHKSGCFFCWAQPPKSWLTLRRKHPDLFEKSMRLEQESTVRDLTRNPLIRLRSKKMKEGAMEEYFGEGSDSCGCFNYNAVSDDEDTDWPDKPF